MLIGQLPVANMLTTTLATSAVTFPCACGSLFDFNVCEFIGRHLSAEVISRYQQRYQQILAIVRDVAGQSRTLKTQKPAVLAGFCVCLDLAKPISGARRGFENII
jgi:hypothetical protein